MHKITTTLKRNQRTCLQVICKYKLKSNQYNSHILEFRYLEFCKTETHNGDILSAFLLAYTALRRSIHIMAAILSAGRNVCVCVTLPCHTPTDTPPHDHVQNKQHKHTIVTKRLELRVDVVPRCSHNKEPRRHTLPTIPMTSPRLGAQLGMSHRHAHTATPTHLWGLTSSRVGGATPHTTMPTRPHPPTGLCPPKTVEPRSLLNL